MGRKLPSIVSRNPDITEDRKNGIELIEKFNKTPHMATKDDTYWFWGDIELDQGKEVDEIAKGFVSDNYDRLNKQYPFEITEWLLGWYSFMPDIIPQHINGTGQIDWNLFFSIIYPLPSTPVPFSLLIKKLNILQLRVVKEQIYQDCYDSLELRNKLLENRPIPSIYTFYIPYMKIRREVVKKLMGIPKKKKEIAPSGSRKIFQAIYKLVKEEDMDFNTALKKVESKNA